MSGMGGTSLALPTLALADRDFYNLPEKSEGGVQYVDLEY
jgi:hypothetical protein